MFTFTCTGALSRFKKLDNGSVMITCRHKSSVGSKFAENSTFFLDPKKPYHRVEEILKSKENTIIRVDGTIYLKKKEDKTTEPKFQLNTLEILTYDAINSDGVIKKEFVLDEDCPF